jgi:hypothetical protein
MFCVFEWCGHNGIVGNATKQGKLLPCYAKFSGKFVGYLQVCTQSYNFQNVQNVQDVLCDLQVQASKLMPHAWRNFEDVVLTFDQQVLTPSGFVCKACKKELTHEEASRACSVLAKSRRVEMSWDDDDEHAFRTMQAQTTVLSRRSFSGTLPYLMFNHGTLLGDEGAYFLKKHKPPRLFCSCVDYSDYGRSTVLADLSFLKDNHAVRALDMQRVLPIDWSCCACIQSLMLMHPVSMDIPHGIANMTNLRHITLHGVDDLPDDFGDLKLESLRCTRSQSLDLRTLIPHLVKMPTLNRLWYANYSVPRTTIPTEIGKLVSLTTLVLSNNHFVGNIPTELGRLTNLSDLHIAEPALSLTCPQEVLDLKVATQIITPWIYTAWTATNPVWPE